MCHLFAVESKPSQFAAALAKPEDASSKSVYMALQGNCDFPAVPPICENVYSLLCAATAPVRPNTLAVPGTVHALVAEQMNVKAWAPARQEKPFAHRTGRRKADACFQRLGRS